VSRVQRLVAGEGVSYGHRFVADRSTTIATLPIGYADGVPRRLWSEGGEVLIDGKRRRITGVVTMDQMMVDCGDDPVSVGDEAVLLGRQGDDRIRSEDWARALDTIGYEITCGIGPRVPRVYARSV
jgi:alanine racemase